jgi:exonuclease VII small subunit
MDKSKVITAYQRGFITVRECGQILGVEEVQLMRLLQQEESKQSFPAKSQRIGS